MYLYCPFKFIFFYCVYYISNDVNFLKVIPILLPILLSVAFFTVTERKILASIQRRRGPNVIGIFGLLQAIADAFKLLSKETIVPLNSNNIIFLIAPIITFILSYMCWVVIPFDFMVVIADINLGILFIFASSSSGVYGIICLVGLVIRSMLFWVV